MSNMNIPDGNLPKEFVDWFEQRVFNVVKQRLYEIENDPNMSQELKDLFIAANKRTKLK